MRHDRQMKNDKIRALLTLITAELLPTHLNFHIQAQRMVSQELESEESLYQPPVTPRISMNLRGPMIFEDPVLASMH